MLYWCDGIKCDGIMNDKRKNDRFQIDEELMFANQLTHPYCYYGAKTVNYSTCGICLSSRYEVNSGDTLCLRMIGTHLRSQSSVDRLTCKAKVRWCRAVSRSKEPEYRIGLNYLGRVPSLFRPDSDFIK